MRRAAWRYERACRRNTVNLSKIFSTAAIIVASLVVVAVSTSDAFAINPWGRPTYSGYPAYGYQYYSVHHHHYVYRPHYHHWHPAGWGNHGPYGGWYGGSFIWHGPGNCEACYNSGNLYYSPPGEGSSETVSPTQEDDLPGEPIPDIVPQVPVLD